MCTRPLEVFVTGNNKGKGLKTNSDIQKGAFVIKYVGEAVTRSEAIERLRTLSEPGEKNSPCYVFITREHFGVNTCKYFCIDATVKGNEARFINHSCDPNLTPIPVRVNSMYPHLALFANRVIRCGEELTFSYGDVRTPTNEGLDLKKCFCESSVCRGYLPFDQTCVS